MLQQQHQERPVLGQNHHRAKNAAPVAGYGGHPGHDDHIRDIGEGSLDRLLTIFAFWGVLGALHSPKHAPDGGVLKGDFGPLFGLFDQAAVEHVFYQFSYKIGLNIVNYNRNYIPEPPVIVLDCRGPRS